MMHVRGGNNRGWWYAACSSRLQLDDEQGRKAADVPKAERCRRPGCRGVWEYPGASERIAAPAKEKP